MGFYEFYANNVQILYLQHYLPWRVYDIEGNRVRNPEANKETTGYILDVKENKKAGVDHYSRILSEKLSNVNNKESVHIVLVPPSNPFKDNAGLKAIVKAVCDCCGYQNGSDWLHRHTEIEKLAHGGNRDKSVHISSVKVADEYQETVKDARVILLDDVVTSGGSLCACKEILENAGCSKVVCLAIGKTI